MNTRQSRFRLNLSLFAQFSILSGLLIAGMAIIFSWVMQRHFEMMLLRITAENVAHQVSGVIGHNLRLTDLRDPINSTRYVEIDKMIREHILGQEIVRVKIWNRDGSIIYSNEKDLRGRRFPVGENLKRALDGEIVMEISSLGKEENIYESKLFGSLIEIYAPLRLMDSQNVEGAYEIYRDMAALKAHIAEMRFFAWAAMGLGFAILYFSLFTIVRNASRQITRRNQENVRLIEEVSQQLAERKRAEGQLKASLEEKEILLKEIHHRAKNNLQIISSLLRLQSRHIHDEKFSTVFQDSQSRIQTMALLHEKLYDSGNFARIDLAAYIRDLVKHLYYCYKADPEKIALTIEVEDIFLGINLAMLCGLIVNELVSNSLKHAFPEGKRGEIIILLSSDQGRVTLSVKDTGVGFHQGQECQRRESLGLGLVNSLTEQLEGKIDFNWAKGTEIRITFPQKNQRAGYLPPVASA